MNIGDSVCLIHMSVDNGKEHFDITEDEIVEIRITKKGVRYYTKSKFHPLNGDEVDGNTKLVEDGFILLGEVFCLNDTIRPHIEDWIKWINK